MRVIGIETSCDETAVAIYDSTRGIIGQAVYSQIELHARFGGVVPELASRDHVRKLLPLLRQTMAAANCGSSDVDGVAYTSGPGLIGALLVGAAVGRSLAWSWGVPAIAVHHLEGHLFAPMLEIQRPVFPFLALLVSGGHTMLIEVRALGRYRVLGETVDDAVGEAFDKTAKLLGMAYPGGPSIERLARQGNPRRFEFPRPMIGRPGLDFSFSGLKTHAVNVFQAHRGEPGIEADIASAFQQAVIDTLAIKCRRALRQTGLRSLVVAGGVGANLALRDRLDELCADEEAAVYYPRAEYCTDNGAMIAYAGWMRLRAGQHEPLAFGAVDRWPLKALAAL